MNFPEELGAEYKEIFSTQDKYTREYLLEYLTRRFPLENFATRVKRVGSYSKVSEDEKDHINKYMYFLYVKESVQTLFVLDTIKSFEAGMHSALRENDTLKSLQILSLEQELNEMKNS